MSTILIVEDEIIIALTASMVLEDEGFRVLIATNGADGLAKARSETVDLILTDYMMPRMDGLSMIRALRSEGFEGPIVLATSIPEHGIDGVPQRPYDAYLGKPFRDVDLIRVVRELLARQG